MLDLNNSLLFHRKEEGKEEDEGAAPERPAEVDSSEAMEGTFVVPLPPPAIR